MILGIDEVGRGAWAGPLVVGAVVLGGHEIEGLTDSKKLTKKQRIELDKQIRLHAAGIGLGWVSADEIDQLGLSRSLALASRRAIEMIDAKAVPYHEIIIDGTINFLKGTSKEGYVTTLKKADLLVPSVSAASIVAKVARDSHMAEQDSRFDGYSFASHVGYGTAAHAKAIDSIGVTSLHRLSFAPLAKFRELPKKVVDTTEVTNRATNYMGAVAEAEATKYLEHCGHKIVERNWKTKYCEIDIISYLDETIYFTEVKYRKRDNQGGGLGAITHKKQKQMEFAATMYAKARNIRNTNFILSAISLTGDPPEVEEFLNLK